MQRVAAWDAALDVDSALAGKKYQYICGRTDIQAAHMMGFQQPEGKCVLFINEAWLRKSCGSLIATAG